MSKSVIDPAARDKYLLQVTAGPTYDPSTHEEVAVNGPNSTQIESDYLTCWLKVRIKDYHGLPHGSPASSPYFSHQLHTSDRYSVAFSFVPKEDFSGKDLVMGFDYDHSIKHQLPPGFKYAMKIATTLLDPGLYSDPYSDNPYLYGPALSGFFSFNIGERVDDVPADRQIAGIERENDGVIEEGAIGSGQAIRDELGLPSKWKKRRKHFLTVSNLENFTFEKGRMYHTDFFNPYLDFANFALRLPGFSISIARYIDEKTHHLRFVLKNRATGKPLFVVFFRLLFGKELEEMLESRKDEKKKVEQGVGDDDSDSDSFHSTDNSPPTTSEGSDEFAKQKAERAGVHQATTPPEAKARDESPDASVPKAAVNSLANSIYATFRTMTFRDDSSSSSEDEARSKAATSAKSLDAKVDNMDKETVEKFLQSKTSNV